MSDQPSMMFWLGVDGDEDLPPGEGYIREGDAGYVREPPVVQPLSMAA